MTFTTNNMMPLLAFICPPLAVYLKHKGEKNMKEMILIATIFTLMLWIPGVLFAYWACFMTPIDENINNVTSRNAKDHYSRAPKPSQNTLTLHNPKPIHPRANQIISFPTSLTSVIIHFPDDLNELHNYLIDNNNNVHIHPKTSMV